MARTFRVTAKDQSKEGPLSWGAGQEQAVESRVGGVVRRARAVADGRKTGAKGPGGTVKSKAAAACTDGEQEVGSPGTEEGEVSHRGPRRFPEPPRKNSRRWFPVGAGPPGSTALPRSFPHGIVTASLLTIGRASVGAPKDRATSLTGLSGPLLPAKPDRAGLP